MNRKEIINSLGDMAMTLISGYPLYACVSNISYPDAIKVAYTLDLFNNIEHKKLARELYELDKDILNRDINQEASSISLDNLINLANEKYEKANEIDTEFNKVLNELHKLGVHYAPAKNQIKYKDRIFTIEEFKTFIVDTKI